MNISLAGKRIGLVLLGIIVGICIIGYFYPFVLHSPTPKPSPKIYSYYEIVDMNTGKTLMFVSSTPVSKNDELITEDNRRFVVVKVIGNKAYAKYVERIKLKNGARKKP